MLLVCIRELSIWLDEESLAFTLIQYPGNIVLSHLIASLSHDPIAEQSGRAVSSSPGLLRLSPWLVGRPVSALSYDLVESRRDRAQVRSIGCLRVELGQMVVRFESAAMADSRVKLLSGQDRLVAV